MHMVVLSYDSFNISPPGKWKLFIRRRSCSIFSDHEAILSISHVDQLTVRSESVHYDFGDLRLICRSHAVIRPRALCSPPLLQFLLMWALIGSQVLLICALIGWSSMTRLEGLWRVLLICVSPPEGECRSKQRPLRECYWTKILCNEWWKVMLVLHMRCKTYTDNVCSMGQSFFRVHLI